MEEILQWRKEQTSPNAEGWSGAPAWECGARAELEKLFWTLPASAGSFCDSLSQAGGKIRNVLLFSLHSSLFPAPRVYMHISEFACIYISYMYMKDHLFTKFYF